MDIGLYLSAFILVFGAICWLVSVVCAWFGPTEIKPNENRLWYAENGPYESHLTCPSKLEPGELRCPDPDFPKKFEPYTYADYLADCEWPVYSENPSKNHDNKEI